MINARELSVGDTIYLVRGYNSFHDPNNINVMDVHEAIGGRLGDNRICIEEYCIEGFIIDEDGVQVAYNTWDGWVEHDLNDGFNDVNSGCIGFGCEAFKTYEEALSFAKPMWAKEPKIKHAEIGNKKYMKEE